jgi:hypothetical protein
MTEDEYVVCDIERQPTVYVNEIGAVKMLHNVISPVTVAIFKQVGLDRFRTKETLLSLDDKKGLRMKLFINDVTNPLKIDRLTNINPI